LTCLLVVALTFEASARLEDFARYGAPLFEPYTFYRLFEADALGMRGRPYATFRQWRMNGLGYLGPEVPPGRPLVVCLGASETFGQYETDGLGYPRLLESQLNERAGAERFTVVNAGIPGQSLPAITRRLPETLEKLRPSLAVIYPSPALYIEPSKLRNPAAVPTRPGSGTRIWERLTELGKRALPDPVQAAVRAAMTRADPLAEAPMERVPDSNIELFRADLRELVVGLREHGVEPVLVTHATAFTNGESERERALLIAWRRFFPQLRTEGFLDLERRGNQAIRGLGSDLGVTVLEAEGNIPPDARHFADFTHFTSDGAARMAELVAIGLQPTLARLNMSAAPR
jgi:hypothetical protein